MMHFGYIGLLIDCLMQIGIDPVAVYGQARLDELAAFDLTTRRPVMEWEAMMAQADAYMAVNVGEGSDIALKMAELLKPMDIGPVGFITMACDTLREAAETHAQFLLVLHDAYTFDVQMLDGRLTTRMVPLSAERFKALELLSVAMICWHNRWLTRRADLRFDVQFSFAQPSAARMPLYEKTFGGELTFDAGETILRRPPGAETLTIARGALGVHEALRTKLTAELVALSATSQSVVHQVECLIQKRLDGGEVSVKDVATSMGLSVRSLQTRLEEMGLSFRTLVDRTRHGMALACISDPRLSLVDIAHMLGFSSQSSFNRAFQRWTNMAPTEYRRARVLNPSPSPLAGSEP